MKIITSILLTLLSAIAFAQTSTTEQLDTKLQEIFTTSHLPGFSIVVANDKEIMFQGSYGFADINQQKPFSNHSLQNIGSVSKTFIAMAIMQTVDKGLVKLDDDINKYLPFKVVNPHFPNDKITLRHLANHSSGILDDAKYSKAYSLYENLEKSDHHKYSKGELEFLLDSNGNKIMDESIYLENVLAKKGKWHITDSFEKIKPGTKSIYSNIGATLAAFVIENATGVRYEELVANNIFQPLNMNHSSFIIDDIHQQDFVTRYFPNGIEVPNYNLITKADGAIITSTTDMAKYIQEMLSSSHGNSNLLSNKAYQEMVTNKPFGEESAGIFWDIKDSGTLSHAGGDPGIMSYLNISPEKNIGIFFMTNILALEYKEPKMGFVNIMKTLKAHKW